MNRPGVAKTATTFKGSVVSGSYERRRLKFCVLLWDVVSCKGAVSANVPKVNLYSSSS